MAIGMTIFEDMPPRLLLLESNCYPKKCIRMKMFRDHSHRHKVPDFIAIPMFKSEIYKELRNE